MSKNTEVAALQENEMGTLPVGTLLRKMALPLIFSMFVQVLYGLVDSMYVARLRCCFENRCSSTPHYCSFPAFNYYNTDSDRFFAGVGTWHGQLCHCNYAGSLSSACSMASVTDGQCRIGMVGISDYGGASVYHRSIPCKKNI